MAGGKNSGILNTCSNIATVSSNGAKSDTSTSFSETLTITGKSKGSCTVTLPTGYGLFGGQKTSAKTITVNVSEATTSKLSCGIVFNSSTKTITATVTGGSGTLASKDDTTWSGALTGKTFTKKVTSGGEYTFTAKDTSGKQADCQITLSEQYQMTKTKETKDAGQIVTSCTPSTTVSCTDIYYIKYSYTTYSDYTSTGTLLSGACSASDKTGTESKTKVYTVCTEYYNSKICSESNLTTPCKAIATYTAQKSKFNSGTYPSTGKYYVSSVDPSALQICKAIYGNCYTIKSHLKQTITKQSTTGNWLSYKEACPSGYTCSYDHKLTKSS